MEIKILEDATEVAAEAAGIIAQECTLAVAARGRFSMAVSGGHTPGQMLAALAGKAVPWSKVYVAQVDERVAPPGHPDRNLTLLHENLLSRVPLAPENVCAMAVDSPDLVAAARQYALRLQEIAWRAPRVRPCSPGPRT